MSVQLCCCLRVSVPALYCVVPYIAACVDVSGTVLPGPFNKLFTHTLCRSVFASVDVHSPDPDSQDCLGFPQTLTLLKLILRLSEFCEYQCML